MSISVLGPEHPKALERGRQQVSLHLQGWETLRPPGFPLVFLDTLLPITPKSGLVKLAPSTAPSLQVQCPPQGGVFRFVLEEHLLFFSLLLGVPKMQ